MPRLSTDMHQILDYEFLRSAIADHDYKKRGCDISADEIFVSVMEQSLIQVISEISSQ